MIEWSSAVSHSDIHKPRPIMFHVICFNFPTLSTVEIFQINDREKNIKNTFCFLQFQIQTISLCSGTKCIHRWLIYLLLCKPCMFWLSNFKVLIKRFSLIFMCDNYRKRFRKLKLYRIRMFLSMQTHTHTHSLVFNMLTLYVFHFIYSLRDAINHFQDSRI